MAEAQENVVITSDVDATASGEDYESRLLKNLSAQFDSEQPEEITDDVQEDEEPEQDDQEEAVETDETEDDEQEEVDEEPEDKVSIRINGKKAAVEDLLDKTQHTVKVDGEESEVSYPELIAGYQRQSNYDKMMHEARQEREEMVPYLQMVAHAKKDPRFVDYVQSYFKYGAYPEAANNPLLRITDDQLSDLLDPDSSSYDAAQASSVMKARRDWTKQHAEREQAQRAATEEQQRMFQGWAEQQIGAARQQIEAQGGDYAEDSEMVRSHLADIGFSEQEIGSLVDARLSVMAWQAAKYRQMVDQQEKPKVRLGKKRQKLSPPRAMSGSGTQAVNKQQRDRKSYRRAVETQKTDDWVAAISNRLNLR